mgnify:CR=1 FL=1
MGMRVALVKTWTWFREPISGLTHFAGAWVGGVATIAVLAESDVNPTQRLAIAVFGFSMVLLLLASSAYHLLPVRAETIRKLRKLDHSAIYVFIAASYTPSCLLLLGDKQGPWVLTVVWLAALAGVVLKLFWMQTSRWLTVGPYLAMGWMSIFVVPDLKHLLSPAGVAWMAAGGAAYTLGAVVYATKRPDPVPGVFGFHEVWHLFVLAGAYSHFQLLLECLKLSS